MTKILCKISTILIKNNSMRAVIITNNKEIKNLNKVIMKKLIIFTNLLY
jgi:hypothetical protein